MNKFHAIAEEIPDSFFKTLDFIRDLVICKCYYNFNNEFYIFSFDSFLERILINCKNEEK